VEAIEEECFACCTRLSSVTFEPGSRLAQIGPRAFARCSSLSSIFIPVSVEKIGDESLGFCENLSRVTFESGSKLSSLDPDVFNNCRSLSAICVPSDLQAILQDYHEFVHVITPEIEAEEAAHSAADSGA
jgi:hypothetical protein